MYYNDKKERSLYIAVPATTGLVFIISLLIIYIVSKVPYLRRIVL